MRSNRDRAVAFLQLASAGRVEEAFQTHVAPVGFRHHNPFFGAGREVLAGAMTENAAKLPTKSYEVKHTLEDGALVAVHGHMKPTPDALGVATVHLFRFENELIVELWDVGLPLPALELNDDGPF